MRERLEKYVTELTSGMKNKNELLKNSLDCFDRGVSEGKSPKEAFGFAMRELDDVPSTNEKPKEYTVGENRWRIRGALRAIRVSYPYGKVHIKQYDGTDTVLKEQNLSEGSEPAKFTFEKGVLSVEYTKKKTVRRGLDDIRDFFSGHRSLDVLVPTKYASKLLDVKLVSASADFEVINLNARVFECETVSGDVSAALCKFESAVFKSASGDWSSKFSEIDVAVIETSGGDAAVKGCVECIEFSSASGSLHVIADNVPDQVRFSSSGGNCKLYIPKSAQFSAELSTAAGELIIGRFEGITLGSKTNRRFICGRNGARYSFSTASGSAAIHVNNAAK